VARITQWEIVKTALTMYNEEHDDLRVANRFIVPEGEPWPRETWGTKLGKSAASEEKMHF
jgi:hypothetical protein